MSARQVITWSEADEMCARLAQRLAGQALETILAIARGGLVPAALVSQHLNLRHVLAASVASYDDDIRGETLHFLEFPTDTVLVGRRILVVDDIWDTGRTAMLVRERVVAAGGYPTVAVLHYKPMQSHYPDEHPDVSLEETDKWIEYPWEKGP